MKKRCILKAPAKLNLHLEIGVRRNDGYHNIKSLFIMTDLYDEIRLSSLKTGNYCRITGDFNCAVEDNLIYKAWVEFCREIGREVPADFYVEKRIPSFAGLGGGSSDAAAALFALDKFFETGLGQERLRMTAGRIGSDVPFFLSGPAAVIEGRGERISPVTDTVELSMLIVQPDLRISTPAAYTWLDNSGRSTADFTDSRSIIEIYNGDPSGYNRFRNDFRPVLVERYEVLGRIFRDLKESGAVYSNITGSGSAVFAVYNSGEETENAENRLQNQYKFVQKIKSLDRIPYAILE